MTTVRLRDGRVGEVTTETITPARAARLARTARGRIHPLKRQVYANLMRQRLWRDGGSITIDGGFLVRGRHAVTAIMDTGITQTLKVIRIRDDRSSHPDPLQG